MPVDRADKFISSGAFKISRLPWKSRNFSQKLALSIQLFFNYLWSLFLDEFLRLIFFWNMILHSWKWRYSCANELVPRSLMDIQWIPTEYPQGARPIATQPTSQHHPSPLYRIHWRLIIQFCVDLLVVTYLPRKYVPIGHAAYLCSIIFPRSVLDWEATDLFHCSA